MGPRKEVGYGNVAAGVGGMVAFLAGLYLCGYTKINLLTGSSTHPLLVPGLVLIVAGLVAVAIGSAGAKRKLRGGVGVTAGGGFGARGAGPSFRTEAPTASADEG